MELKREMERKIPKKKSRKEKVIKSDARNRLIDVAVL
jgi:hypothetical protein